MDLAGLFGMIAPGLPEQARREFMSAWKPHWAEKGTSLARQGDQITREFVILDGQAISQICDSEGRSVCVGFHTGPGVVTPHVARSRLNVSLVSVELTTDATVAHMEAEKLMAMMLESSFIRDWANGVLRAELARKTDREWILAALGGAERLTWFRENYPDHESLFAHGLIASFLGMTPVSLSRLRAKV